jgi:ribonuclease HI
VGVIARDHAGDPKIMAWRLLVQWKNVEEAEALACLEGLRFAERWSENIKVILDTDNAIVEEKINNPALDRSEISGIISDIKEEVAKRQSCTVLKIWREQNKIAHNLAQFAIKSRTSKASFSFVPLCIQEHNYRIYL